MRSIYESLDSFKIESAKVTAYVRNNFELVKYEIHFSVEKLNDELNTWQIISPIDGFTFISAKDSNGEDIDKTSTTSNGLRNITLDLTKCITSNKMATFDICYENRLESEIISSQFPLKDYGILFTRSFGSYCERYSLDVIIENKYYTFKDMIPKYAYPKSKSFEFTNIPSQKPVSVTITAYFKIKKIGIFVIFILTVLAGHYIPKILSWILTRW